MAPVGSSGWVFGICGVASGGGKWAASATMQVSSLMASGGAGPLCRGLCLPGMPRDKGLVL